MESEALVNSSTQFDWDEIKRAWDNCYGENLETFYYGFYLELEKIAKKKEFKQRLGVSDE
jgi:hypothetical protein